jgi:hypothetical protein
MTKIEELEKEVSALPEKEYSQFRQWFLDRDWEMWDREIEADANEGRLEFLVQEAAEAKMSRQLKDL